MYSSFLTMAIHGRQLLNNFGMGRDICSKQHPGPGFAGILGSMLWSHFIMLDHLMKIQDLYKRNLI